MKLRALPAAMAALVLASTLTCASAAIFRCRTPQGAVSYQEIPCPETAPGAATDIPSAYPEANYAERERLLRREAELDARLLRRAEIDAQVQIAREARLAREREAELQREAANEAPVWFVPVAYRNAWRSAHRRAIGQRPQPRWP